MHTHLIGEPPLDPPDEDDDLTADEALGQAQEELESTPAIVAEWLAEECADDAQPLDAYLLLSMARTLTPPEALAVLMSAPDADALRALHQLRAAFEAATAGRAEERATELMTAQAQHAERAASDAARAEFEAQTEWVL